MAGLPTGTVTFLFTDLERSTRLWEERPEAMRPALARHDELLRTAVEADGGAVVKTTGDGVHAAFATAEGAISAAAAGQRALAAEPWGDAGELRVRMGLHTGSAELRDDDYYGPAVNRAARMMSAAHGGQVLVSHATEEVVRDGLPPGFGLVDLGEHRLRDLSRPEHIFQLTAPGLTAEFPPLATLEAFPGNLPVQRTSFVGRDDELADIVRAFEGARLVTLTGVGGVGKTRLALHAAAELVPRFRHGAWVCELAPMSDPEALPEVVALALGIKARQGVAVDVGIVDFLREKEILVVLDNCEHVLDAAGAFASDVLDRCPRVRILATSREALGVDGEQVWPVETLDVAAAGPGIDGAAEQLFRDRARAANPQMPTDSRTDADVTDICRRLDGIPLAIELAAARVISMTPAEIAARLDERLRLLSGKRRGDLEHHQTLRATIDWSYRLLEPTEQRVFERLSVLAGSFDAAGAEAIVSGDGVDAPEVVDALTGLAAKSMIVVQASARTTRYELLETLREYGRVRLDEHDDGDRWRRRALEHYVAFADDYHTLLWGPDEDRWAQRLSDEGDNIRECVTWAIGHSDQEAELALQIVGRLARAFNQAFGQGLGVVIEQAAELASRVDPGLGSTVLAAAAWSAIHRGDADRARRYAEAAVADPRIAVQGPVPEIAFSAISMVEATAGNPEKALRRALEGARELEAHGASDAAILSIKTAAAAWACAAGQPDVARVEAEASLAMARRIGSPALIAGSLFGLGLALEFEDVPRALAAHEESVALRRFGSGFMALLLGRSLAAIAHLRSRAGDTPGALAALREAFIWCIDTGQRTELIASIDRAVDVVCRAGHDETGAVLQGVATLGPLASVNTVLRSTHVARRESRLRDQLGDEVFEAAMDRGAAMPYEDVVDFVTTEVDRMLAELGG